MTDFINAFISLLGRNDLIAETLLCARGPTLVSLHTSLICVDIAGWSWLGDQCCPLLSGGDKVLVPHLEKKHDDVSVTPFAYVSG